MKTRTSALAVLLMLTAATIAVEPALAQPTPLCAAPSVNAYVNWPKYHSDLCNTGYNPNEFILSPANVGNLVVKWNYQMADGLANSSPALANGVVYGGSEDGNLYAVNAATGALLWKY